MYVLYHKPKKQLKSRIRSIVYLPKNAVSFDKSVSGLLFANPAWGLFSKEPKRQQPHSAWTSQPRELRIIRAFDFQPYWVWTHSQFICGLSV